MESVVNSKPTTKNDKSQKGDLYLWGVGDSLPTLDDHSLTKHRILREYLERYVAILTKNRGIPQLNLSLVDGFAGGGAYLHHKTNERLPGSPVLMLEAMAAAEVEAKALRTKDFSLNTNYYFVEERKRNLEFLKSEVKSSPAAIGKDDSIHFINGTFSDQLPAIIKKIKAKGSSHKAIFLLDQYGYTHVTMANIRQIFRELPRAEVILTIAVNWLIDFVNETDKFKAALRHLELVDQQDELVRLRTEHCSDWRTLIQQRLHKHFFKKSGAACYTPFFVHSVKSHRGYWLLHFSMHSTARDAMTDLHWSKENHFEHFGGPGLGMFGGTLGFDPRSRRGETQSTFLFDKSAKEQTRDSLLIQLPKRLSQFNGLITFGHFFNQIVNDSPATKQMIAEVFGQLASDKEIEIFTKDKKERRGGVKISEHDLIRIPQITSFLPIRRHGE
jgi:three-Cys-motif partner protein